VVISGGCAGGGGDVSVNPPDGGTVVGSSIEGAWSITDVNYQVVLTETSGKSTVSGTYVNGSASAPEINVLVSQTAGSNSLYHIMLRGTGVERVAALLGIPESSDSISDGKVAFDLAMSSGGISKLISLSGEDMMDKVSDNHYRRVDQPSTLLGTTIEGEAIYKLISNSTLQAYKKTVATFNDGAIEVVEIDVTLVRVK
jgi:hypothetical protein